MERSELLATRAIHRSGAGILVGLFVILASYFSLVVPIFEAPDELWHYDVVADVAQGRFADPTGPARQEATQPPLYYVFAALLWRLAPADSTDLEVQRNPYFDTHFDGTGNKNLIYHGAPGETFPFQGIARTVHLVRLASVVLGAVTVLGVLSLSRAIFPRQPRLGLLAAAFCALNPEFLFLSGSISNDLAIVATSTWTMVYLARWLSTRSAGSDGRINLVALSVISGLALLSKASALALLGLVGWTILVYDDPTKPRWRPLLKASLVLGGSLVIGGWWYVRLWLFYRDPLGTTVRDVALGRKVPFGVGEAVNDLIELAITFVARFGWANVAPPTWLIVPLLVLSGLGLALGIFHGWARSKPGFVVQLAWIGLILVMFYVWQIPVPGAQGRLIFPAIGSIGLLWAVGIDSILIRLGSRMQSAVSVALVGGMVAVNAALAIAVIIPAYPPQGTKVVTSLPLSAHITKADFGDEVSLVGYSLSDTDIKPGEDVLVRLYWQRGSRAGRDLSFDVKALDSGGRIVTSEDNGLSPDLPLRIWPKDRVVEISTPLHISKDTPWPQLLSLNVGVYSATGGSVQHVLVIGDSAESIVLATLRIDVLQPPAPQSATVSFVGPNGDALSLIGSGLGPPNYGSPRLVQGFLVWRAESPPKIDYTVFVHLLRGGKVVAQRDARPLNGAFPFTAWRSGEFFRDDFSLIVPDDLAPGPADVEVGLYDLKTLTRLRFLGGDAWKLTTVDIP